MYLGWVTELGMVEVYALFTVLFLFYDLSKNWVWSCPWLTAYIGIFRGQDGCFPAQLGWECILAVVCTYASTLGGVFESAPSGDSIFLLGDVHVHVGKDSEAWMGRIGRNSLTDQNANVFSYMTPVSNNKSMCHKDTLGCSWRWIF